MNVLEKKCLFASVSAHGIVVLLLCLAPLLWVPKPQPPVLPPLNFLPSRLLDGVMGGGGSPKAKSLPTPAPSPAPALPTPAQLQNLPPKPEVKTPVEPKEPPAKPRAAKAAAATLPDPKLAK